MSDCSCVALVLGRKLSWTLRLAAEVRVRSSGKRRFLQVGRWDGQWLSLLELNR